MARAGVEDVLRAAISAELPELQAECAAVLGRPPPKPHRKRAGLLSTRFGKTPLGSRSGMRLSSSGTGLAPGAAASAAADDAAEHPVTDLAITFKGDPVPDGFQQVRAGPRARGVGRRQRGLTPPSPSPRCR